MKLNSFSLTATMLFALSASTTASAQSISSSPSADTAFSLTCKTAQLMPLVFPDGLLVECALARSDVIDPSVSTQGPARPKDKNRSSIVDPHSGPQTGTKNGIKASK